MGFFSKFKFGSNTYQVKDSGVTYASYSGSDMSTAVISASDFDLHKGSIVIVKFEGAYSAINALNINSTGAKAIYRKGAAINSTNKLYFYVASGESGIFMYDGTAYQLLGCDRSCVMMETPSEYRANTTDYTWTDLYVRKYGPVVQVTMNFNGIPRYNVPIIYSLPKPLYTVYERDTNLGYLRIDANTGNLICYSTASTSKVYVIKTITYLCGDLG